MRILKSILVIIVIAAILAAVYFLVFNSKNPSTSVAASKSIIINEFMASNSSFLPDDKGQYNDWIEIYNPTDNAVDLSGYGLSNDKKSPKWKFPGIMLQPKGIIVIFASGTGTSDANAVYQHANFKLNAANGGIYLFDAAGTIVDSEGYKDQTGNVSTGRDPNNSSQWVKFVHPTPGFANDETGYAAFLQSRAAKSTGILITEAMPSNKTAIADNNGNFSDYIEIYNKSDKAINLNGYGLSDAPAYVLKWTFPDVSIDPGVYLVVFASGEDKNGTDLKKNAIHTNFSIAAYKETIVLSDPMGYVLDQVSISQMPEDTAYARVLGDGGAYTDKWEQTNRPTPGYVNNAQGYTEFQKSKVS